MQKSFDWTVNAIPSAFLREQQAEGLRHLYSPSRAECVMLEGALAKVWRLFHGEITSPLHPPIIGVFSYDAGKCAGDYGSADAICVASSAGQSFSYFCLGFDRRAFSAGADYLQFLVLHELAHALAWYEGHGPHYEAKLDEMIMRFNAATGAGLTNDYTTFNDEGGGA